MALFDVRFECGCPSMGGDSSFKKKNKKKKKPHVVDMASRTPHEEYSRLCIDRAGILERTAVAAREPAYSRELLLLLVVEAFTRAETLPTASSH